MERNFLEQIQEKRKQIKLFAEKAFTLEWISEEDYLKILQRIENDVFTIGVIGQMKAGKSTFLNSMLFGQEILPAATTPMTAALSVITYGKEEKIEVEFYTACEWNEIKSLADNNEFQTDNNSEFSSKVKACKELVEKSLILGSSIERLLGSKNNDSLINLIDYVGANGKYVAITKSVTIYHPTEWLKGVRIVDTPGFNDPVVSREARTQEFLKFADIVVVLLYAGRAFDATDKEIIFERVKSVGIGKIIIAINKYDINYSQGENTSEMIDNVKNEITLALQEAKDPLMNDLLKDIEPIPISAQMALFSKLPMTTILNDEDKKFHWKKLTDDFEISTQSEMSKQSLVRNLEQAIINTLEKEKLEILVRKPVSFITKQGEKKALEIENKIISANQFLKTLKLSDDDIETKIDELKKAEKKIRKSIDSVKTDLAADLEEKLGQQHSNLQDFVNNEKKKIDKIIDDAGKFKRDYTIRRIINYLEVNLYEKSDRIIEDNIKALKKEVKNSADELIKKISTDLIQKLDNSEDFIEEFENSIKRIKAELEDEEIEKFIENDEKITLLQFAGAFLTGALIIPYLFNELSWKNPLRDDIDKEFINIKSNLPNLKDKFKKLNDYLLQKFDTEAVINLLTDLISNLEDASKSKEIKDAKISEQEKLLNENVENKKLLEIQSAEIKSLKLSLNI